MEGGTMVVIKSTRIPLYHQLRDSMRAHIENGEFKIGDAIPSEKDLCKRYVVSRMTVRLAIKELVNEGLLVRSAGKGTFVCKPSVEQNLHKLTSFTEDMISRGFEPSSVIVSQEVVPGKDIKRIAEKLRLDDNDRIIKTMRLRLADGQPMAIETTHIPYILCPALLKEDLVKGSIKKILEGKWGLIYYKAEQTIEAGLADDYEAKMLGIKKGKNSKSALNMTQTPAFTLRGISLVNLFKFLEIFGGIGKVRVKCKSFFEFLLCFRNAA
jgi:GntR family transcriptional regulator